MADETVSQVQDFYGKRVQSKDDFQCSVKSRAKIPKSILSAMKEVHDDIAAKYYGCGLCIPSCLEGCSILDCGSGAGRDCFIASKLVGQHGHVTGVDITDELVEVANKYKDYHRKQFGHDESNIDFILGCMDKLEDAHVKNNTYDINISNCVICLSSDKTSVLTESFRVLKPGGELYFSDMYSDKPIPDHIRNSGDGVLWGEGLSGTLCWRELMDIAEKVGFTRPRLVSTSEITVKAELQELVRGINYISVTYRLFKPGKPQCEAPLNVRYRGSVTDCTDELMIDANNTFKTGQVVHVDTDLASILRGSRYAAHFDFDVDSDSSDKEMTSQPNNPNPFETDVKSPISYNGAGQ